MTTSYDSITVVKKTGMPEKFNPDKIYDACNKAAERGIYRKLTNDEKTIIIEDVIHNIEKHQIATDAVSINTMHALVEHALNKVSPEACDEYKKYRNWKINFAEDYDEITNELNAINYRGDKSNANTDSALVSTKKSLGYNILNKKRYQRFFMTPEELQACKDGYIYVHDMSARLDSMNCCLFDIKAVLMGGFEMGNIFYEEPKSLDVAFDVIGDIVLGTASQQYGGFTLPEIDSVLEPFAKKSWDKYYDEYISMAKEALAYASPNAYDVSMETVSVDEKALETRASLYADKKLKREFEQGFQGWEMKFNTVASSRGDYPFISISFGLNDSKFGRMCNVAMCQVRMKGQGRNGKKKPVLFPKLILLFDENILYPGHEVFEAAIDCSCKTMYPDWVSLTGEGYIASVYKKYGKAISLMGCRASLSPWFERGGMTPADDKDEPIFIGRFNMGVISLHLPMILAKAREEGKDFYEVLDFYMEMSRKLHLRTIEYLGTLKASTNPVAFCEGGFYGGHLKPSDNIKPLLKSATISFGITALNELQELYNGKSIYEDGEFALEVMKYINDKIAKYKKEDGVLYAIYGTPAESLCFTGDTLVQTEKGNVPIKDLKVGDMVYSYNQNEKKIELKPIVAHALTKESANVMNLTFDNGSEVKCTPEHLFGIKYFAQNSEDTPKEYVGFMRADKLSKGSIIRGNSSGNDDIEVHLTNSHFVKGKMTVYDIEVQDNHNFYVGGDNGILVHNCGLQIKQFRKKFGVIKGVSDRPYVSNSFHCHVTEPITPIEKQDSEERFWDLFNGGKIQYVRYPVSYNRKAVVDLILRAMKKGFYEGVNMSLAYCDDCGHEELEMDVCPVCGSKNLTKIDRMNGYLAYSRVKGDTRLNEAKMAEISERVSM